MQTIQETIAKIIKEEQAKAEKSTTILIQDVSSVEPEIVHIETY